MSQSIAHASMLIRRGPAEIFDAFVNPDMLCRFWLDAELTCEFHDGDATRVAIACSGFPGDDLVAQATNNVEGFTIVLCDLKTLLESGRSANLVRDKAELITRQMALAG
jgi:uncharacterized protein YndB with AHSA1/START domain